MRSAVKPSGAGTAAHCGSGVPQGPDRIDALAPGAGEEVARMYQEPGLAWLKRQAEVAETWSPRAKGSAAPPLM